MPPPPEGAASWVYDGTGEGCKIGALRWEQMLDATEPDSFPKHKQVAKQGGEVARNARLELEAKTGRKVISPLSAKDRIMLERRAEKLGPSSAR